MALSIGLSGYDRSNDYQLRNTNNVTQSTSKPEIINTRNLLAENPNSKVYIGSFGDKIEIGEQARQMNSARTKGISKVENETECQACANRKYVDGSNDPGVSFKAPGHISPEASASTVMAHEREHVSNRRASAQTEGKKVISQSVQIFTDICSECGKAYVSGGRTRTVTATNSQASNQQIGSKLDKFV